MSEMDVSGIQTRKYNFHFFESADDEQQKTHTRWDCWRGHRGRGRAGVLGPPAMVVGSRLAGIDAAAERGHGVLPALFHPGPHLRG